MDALLAVLAADPRRKRRRVLAAAVAAALAVGLLRVAEHRGKLCRGGAEIIAEVWSPARRTELSRAFEATGSPLAAQAFAAAAAALDRHAAGWSAMHRSACEATHVAGEQSAALLDLRMACLEQRRRETAALLGLLTGDASAGSPPIDLAAAVDAATSLPPLARCADARALLAPVPPPAGPETEARVAALQQRLAGTVVLERLGRYDEGAAAAREVVDAAEALGYWPLTAEALVGLGVLEERGSSPEAAATLARAVDAAVAGGHDRAAAEALVRLVRVHGYQRSDHARAHYYARLAEAALDRLGEPDELAADLADHLGRLAFQEGGHDEALAAHRRALELRRRALGSDHPEVGSTLLRLAAVEADRGGLAAARTHAEEAVALYRAGYGPDHPRLAVGLVNLGNVLYRQGELEAALAADRRALEIREQALGDSHLQTADARLQLANVLLGLGRTDEALDAFRRVQAVFAERLGDGHPRMAAVLSSIATVHVQRNEHRQAVELYRRALAIEEQVYGADHPWVANTLYNLGVAHRKLGEPGAGEEYFRRSLAVWESRYGEDHYLVAYALTGLGQALVDLGRPREAIPPLERALQVRLAEGETDPELLASTRFTLARALDAASGDRGRARELAAAAFEAFRQERQAERAAEVAAWLDDHHGDRKGDTT
jgi:tetratricopeptide (TPR) repeat protein